MQYVKFQRIFFPLYFRKLKHNFQNAFDALNLGQFLEKSLHFIGSNRPIILIFYVIYHIEKLKHLSEVTSDKIKTYSLENLNHSHAAKAASVHGFRACYGLYLILLKYSTLHNIENLKIMEYLKK